MPNKDESKGYPKGSREDWWLRRAARIAVVRWLMKKKEEENAENLLSK